MKQLTKLINSLTLLCMIVTLGGILMIKTYNANTIDAKFRINHGVTTAVDESGNYFDVEWHQQWNVVNCLIAWQAGGNNPTYSRGDIHSFTIVMDEDNPMPMPTLSLKEGRALTAWTFMGPSTMEENGFWACRFRKNNDVWVIDVQFCGAATSAQIVPFDMMTTTYYTED